MYGVWLYFIVNKYVAPPPSPQFLKEREGECWPVGGAKQVRYKICKLDTMYLTDMPFATALAQQMNKEIN